MRFNLPTNNTKILKYTYTKTNYTVLTLKKKKMFTCNKCYINSYMTYYMTHKGIADMLLSRHYKISLQTCIL